MRIYDFFCTVYDILEDVYIKTKDETLLQFVSDANPYLWADEGSADPAVFAEFRDFFNRAEEIPDEKAQDEAIRFVKSLKIPEATRAMNRITADEWDQYAYPGDYEVDFVPREPTSEEIRLNMNYARLLNSTKMGRMGMLPELICDIDVYPGFLALSDESAMLNNFPLCGLCFYQYDNEFDGPQGLFEAIYHNNKKRLKCFREKYKNAAVVLSPDYSISGDWPVLENYYRMFRARIVSLWFMLELNIPVVPSISFTSEKDFPIMLDGLDSCTVAAFSTKGFINKPDETELIRKAVRYTVDHLHLKSIIVYDVCWNNEKAMDLFSYAVQKGIEIIIPANTLKNRNAELHKNQLRGTEENGDPAQPGLL